MIFNLKKQFLCHFVFCHFLGQYSSESWCLGVFWNPQDLLLMMGTRILKIEVEVELFTFTAIASLGLRLASNPVCKDQCHCNPVWRPLLCETLNSGDIFCLNPLLSFQTISVSRQEFTSVKLSQFEFCRKLIDSVFFEVSACTILYNSECIWDQQYNKGIRDFGPDILLTQGNCWWSKNVYVSQFAESMSKIFEKAFYSSISIS